MSQVGLLTGNRRGQILCLPAGEAGVGFQGRGICDEFSAYILD
jgi:hypothetical protein